MSLDESISWTLCLPKKSLCAWIMFDGLLSDVTLLNQFKDADNTGVGMLYLVVICRTLLMDVLFLSKVLKIVFKLKTLLFLPNSFFN